jgi:tetratricopeptide (TPR) repeat protein
MGETFKKYIGFIIGVVTLIATIVAFMQSDAGNKDDSAQRDANSLMVETLGQRVSGTAQVNYDYDEAYQTWQKLNTLAIAAENRDDTASANRYYEVRDSIAALSPMMQAPYFDPETQELNIARYEADVYLTNVTRLNEEYTAAAGSQEAWGDKANLYIVHLTILAVSLFLLGLSTTIESRSAQLIFTVAGIGMAGVATVWAISVYTQPVFDLRSKPEAIDAYARGYTLAYQGEYAEAIQLLDTAIADVPDYTNAYIARGEAYAASGNLEQGIADLIKARELGASSPNVAGNIAWFYHQLGRFEEAIAMDQAGVAQGGELWIQFDLGMNLLAAGRIDEARAAYQAGMDSATQQVTTALAQGEQPPASLWLSLGDGASGLDNLRYILNGGEGVPPRANIQKPDEIAPVTEELTKQLKSLAVSLEYRGKPAEGELTAQITNLTFAEPLYDEDFVFLEYYFGEEGAFEYGINEIDLLFDYAGMQDGQEMVVKVYIDGIEDPSWRVVKTWDGGASGEYVLPLAIAYSDTFVLNLGEFFVELYIDGHLAGEAVFEVVEG